MNESPAQPETVLNEKSPAFRQRLLTIFVLGLCVAWIVSVRIHTRTEPLERDIVCGILMAHEMSDGARFFVDVVEFKPPGHYVIWQIADAVVGTEPQGVLIVNIVVALVTLAGCYAAGSAAPWGPAGGRWAAVFWALVGGEMYLQANQPNIEVFINAMFIWAFALLVRAEIGKTNVSTFVAVGLLLAGATLQKHHVFFIVIALGFAWVWSVRGNKTLFIAALKQGSIVACSVAAIWFGVIGYFSLTGRFEAMINQLFRYAVFYASTQGGEQNAQSGGVLENIRQGLLPGNLIPLRSYFITPLLFPTALAAVGVGSIQNEDVRRRNGLLLAAWIVGAFFVVALPGTFFSHYYQLYLPALSIGAAWGLVSLAESFPSRVAARISAAALLLPVFIVPYRELQISPDQWSVLKYQEGIFVEVRQTGERLNQLLAPDETFYIFGWDPGVYYYAKRRPPTGIMWASRVLHGPMAATWTQDTIRHLEEKPPVLIVKQLSFSLPKDHPLFRWISARYVELPNGALSPNFNHVLVLRGSRLAQQFGLNDNTIPPTGGADVMLNPN